MKSKILHFQFIAIVFMLFFSYSVSAQNLEDIVNSLEEDKTEKVEGFFKATRIINGMSIENAGKNELSFTLSHRFGLVSSGFYDFYGLDVSASIRIGFEYGINHRLSVGTGRSNHFKTYDTYLKYKILEQKTGSSSMPLSLSVFASEGIKATKQEYADGKNPFSRRLYYSTGLICASKLSEKLTLQFTPAFAHRNIVATSTDKNDVFFAGIAGRYKLTKRMSLSAEYYHWLNRSKQNQNFNSLALGIDIETGGHVFQIHLTNTEGLVDEAFVTQTTSNWKKGDVHIGFNICRIFAFKNKKEKLN